MGKKKNRQNSNMAVNVECTEPWDASNNQTADADDSCKHIAKVLKRLKNYENFKNSKENFGFCGFCKVSSQTDSKKSLQLCLSCGACTCGTDGENHALDHFKTPRSESHCLTIELESFSLWCFACNLEPVIPQKCRARIDEIKEKIKNVSEKHQTPRKPSSSGSSESKALNKNQFMASNKEDKRSLPALPNKVKVPDIPNKVKGLSNLGNTCFFNSVLQCLAQTPGLAECLREMRKGGEEISIVPKDSEPIRGTLEKGGPVSGCLLDLITEMTSESSPPNSYGKSVLVPRELMTELGKKCPQLMDGDQHDSHELLRQLLDVVFNEDLKRYRRIILKKYGLEKAKTDEVADEKRKWLKELDNLVPEQFVMKPYEVFRGTLVSELQCEECHNISSREENFLDLSLPVNVEKPLPPAFARRKLSQNNAMNGKLPCTVQCSGTADDNKVEDAKSPKRGNRRSMKRNFRDHGEGCITEEEKKENDADVEDNVEIGGDDQKEVFESGYSSEKPASSRTSPTTESRQNNGDADDSACASPSASMPSMPPMSTAVSAALANLAAVDQPAELTDSVKLPDTVSSNLPVANLLPYIESDNSSDSAGSLRANAAFSSPDLSTESICTGVLSQERSCGSDHDDSQSNDNITISKELESMANSQFIGTNFHQSTSTFYQSGDYNIGPITTAHDEPSCSPNEEFNKFESALKALEVEEEEEEEEKHMKQYEAKTSISRFDDSSQIENKVTNESGDFNCGLTITPIEGSSSAANEVCCNIDSETNLPCFNNASPNSRLTETNAENETDSFKSKLRALELQDVGKQHEYETERPCFHNSSSTETTEGKQSGAYNNVQTITALEENPYPINEESDKCDNLEQRLSEEDQADEIESKSLCCKNDSHDGYESLSNDEARNVCSRPSSRLEHVNSMARSSPVDVSNNSPLDGELVEKCLENIIFTEKLKSETANEEIERPSVPRAPSNINSDIAERKDQNSPPSNSGHLGFVLVGGITSTTNNDISRVESASIKEIPNSDTVRPTCNISNDECAEVSPELYKKNHMTLAPRYQCEEGECSVLSCLNHFTAIEMMAGNNKAGCDMCTKRQNKGKEKDAKTVYTNSTKRLLISKPPPILILHLKRFQVQMRSFRKLSCHVTFPLELDIAPFCSKSCEKLLEKGQTKLLYSLYGVVEHSGTLHGGHYVAYVKVREGEQKPNQPREGSWYYISDSQVSPVKEENVLRTQAYLLFYERIM